MSGRRTPEIVLTEVEQKVDSQEERLKYLLDQNANLNDKVMLLQQQLMNGFHKAIQKPFLYGGERNAVTIENWIYAVKQYVKAFGMSGEYAVVMAASYLDKSALQYWRVKLAENPAIGRNLDEFCELVKLKFYPTGFIHEIRDKLGELRQRTSVKEYAERFENLLLQLPLGEYHTNDMKDLFIRHLKPEVKKLVLVNDPTTLEDAMELAQRIDKIVFDTRSTHIVRKHINKDHDAMEVDYVKKQKGLSVKCFGCGKQGHFKRDCKSVSKQGEHFPKSQE